MPELQFKGKEFVYNHHLTVPFRPLEMQADKGIGAPRLDGNLIIHGDNLLALKALLPTHAGKVDCIFIDPPYNTGNEGWCYNDNVNSPMIREWLASNPIGLDDGLRHDKWACMMWPRLKLLHELLSEDGSLWMTLDDNEAQRAKLILDQIFGDGNFVANVIWQKKYAPQNDAKWFSDNHDNLLVYAKTKGIWHPNQLGRGEGANARYRNLDNDSRGPWKPGDALRNEYREYAFYELETPAGQKFWPPKGTSWRFNKEDYPDLLADNRLWFGADGNGRPAIKRFLSEVKQGVTPMTIWPYQEVGHNQEATRELDALGLRGEFATPKPTRLIDRVLELATDRDSIILDSFAGSGTTAHSVLATNARDSGNRRFILVEGESYANTLTAERVRRVIKGYPFKGTQREELLREPLNFSKLKNANALLEKVTRIETLDGPKYDRIKPTLKDGVLIVTGERDVAERAPGLGGEFTYCELGPPIEMDSILSGQGLPDPAAMAGLLWHTATAQPFDLAHMTPASEIGEGVARLGEFAGRTYWLIYRDDLDWLKSGEAALSLTKARAIAATAAGNHLVFAPAKFVSRELLARERLDVDYAPLPFALYRLETA